METKNLTKNIITAYYDELIAKRNGWASMLSEEITFAGPTKSHEGKEAFKATLTNFLSRVQGLRVKQTIADNGSASVIANYDMLSPHGKKFSIDVAEIWEIKNGKLGSLTIYFDTAHFRESMA